MTNLYSYNQYHEYINFVVNNSYDEEDLRDAIKNQTILSDETILTNHQQHPCYLPDTALYLDAIKLFKQRTPK